MPKTFNGVGGNITLHIFLHPVTDDIVNVPILRKTVVSGHFIGKHLTVVSNELLDDRHKGNDLGVLHLKGLHAALAGYHTEDGCLGLGGTALRLLRLLGLVLVGLTATKIHFIQLHLAVKGGGVVLCIEYAPYAECTKRSSA